jgi:AraC-like DNA-binding protein
MFEASLLILRLFREVGGAAFQPLYVSYENDVRSADVDEIERLFGCPLRSNRSFNAIGFPTRLLNLRVASASRQLFQLLKGYLERLRQSTRVTLLDRLEDCVRSSFQSGKCSAEWCAKKLGMSPRTLRIRLDQLNLRFSDVVERQRIGLAFEYLHQPEMTLDDVAFALGYSEQSSFGRAFKRWTGTTPQSHRAMQSAKGIA